MTVGRDGREADAGLHQARPGRGRRGARPPRGLDRASYSAFAPVRRVAAAPADRERARPLTATEKTSRATAQPWWPASHSASDGQPEDDHLHHLRRRRHRSGPWARRTAPRRPSPGAGGRRRAASAAYRPASPTPERRHREQLVDEHQRQHAPGEPLHAVRTRGPRRGRCRCGRRATGRARRRGGARRSMPARCELGEVGATEVRRTQRRDRERDLGVVVGPGGLAGAVLDPDPPAPGVPRSGLVGDLDDDVAVGLVAARARPPPAGRRGAPTGCRRA